MLIDLTFKLSLPLLLVLLIAFPACGGFEEPRQVYVWNFARKPLASALAAAHVSAARFRFDCSCRLLYERPLRANTSQPRRLVAILRVLFISITQTHTDDDAECVCGHVLEGVAFNSGKACLETSTWVVPAVVEG